MSSGLHAVVPYPATNASVRARILEWSARVEPGTVTVYGPGFRSGRPPANETTLLLRNARRFSRGRYERRLLERAGLSIYELDDGLPWDDGRLPGLGHWWKRPWPRHLIAQRAGAAADRIIVGNEVLAEWAATVCPDVRLIPTCVDPDAYRTKDSYDLSGRPCIGWIGSPATEGYLWDLAEVFAEVHRQHDIELAVIGSAGPVPQVIAPFTRRLPWSPGLAEQALATWDVGVMPLWDGVYERAKCGYKLLQYAAAGLPVVGSPVGVNESILAGMDGLSPRSPQDWIDCLVELITESTQRRAARGAAGRAVAARFSFAAWLPTWSAAVGRA